MALFWKTPKNDSKDLIKSSGSLFGSRSCTSFESVVTLTNATSYVGVCKYCKCKTNDLHQTNSKSNANATASSTEIGNSNANATASSTENATANAIAIAKESATPNAIAHVKPKSAEISYFDCNVCFKLAEEPVVGFCGHIFCWSCLSDLFAAKPFESVCPVCGEVLTPNEIIALRKRNKNSQNQHKLLLAMTNSLTGLELKKAMRFVYKPNVKTG